MSVAMEEVPNSNLCPVTRFPDDGIFLGFSESLEVNAKIYPNYTTTALQYPL
jgi:hypothetical protein